MQWTSHCVSRQIDFVGVLVGLWPRFLWCFCWFCCLLWFSAGETQVWLGDLRVVVLVGFCVCVIYRFAYPIGHDCPLYKYFFCLCSCKDRAFSATSATLEEKKVGTNWEPNGTSLCMEELGDGFSFVFVVFGVFGCCLTHVLGT